MVRPDCYISEVLKCGTRATDGSPANKYKENSLLILLAFSYLEAPSAYSSVIGNLIIMGGLARISS
jgi:hypothetical protein